MTDDTIHTCSYSCERPGCIRAQRDELAARMATETSNARGEWALVPRNPTQAMIDAWRDAPNRWVEAYAAMLAAAPPPADAQQGQAVAECHCATCTCNPRMTPAIRFDTTPAEREEVIRDHLIALGWTPPGAQQPAAEEQLTYKGVPIGPMQTFADMERQASAPVGADWITGDGLQGIKAEAHFLTQHKEEAVQRAGKRLLDRADKIIAALYQPPSVPVGVEAFESRLRGRAGPFTAQPGERYVDADIALAVLREALAQQPAAVDEARSGSLIMDGAVSFVEALAAQPGGSDNDR